MMHSKRSGVAILMSAFSLGIVVVEQRDRVEELEDRLTVDTQTLISNQI